jgi:hypothetical protein
MRRPDLGFKREANRVTSINQDANAQIRSGKNCLLIKISQDNFDAFATRGARDFPTYAARRAGNDGDLAFEIHGKLLSFVWHD